VTSNPAHALHNTRRESVCFESSDVMWFFCIAGILCSVTQVIAQIDRGTIEGLVKDPSGAVIPGAKVKIIQIATNSAYDLVTNGEGLWWTLIFRANKNWR
jgi:hypothetical protein